MSTTLSSPAEVTRADKHPADRVVVVCLPPSPRPDRLLAQAADRLAAHGLSPRQPAPHFLPDSRRDRVLLTRRLLHTGPNTAAGGPVGLLDLAGMRARAAATAATQWRTWQDVVTGTRAARPYWSYLERHREDPQRYPLAQLRQQYLTQPRVQAMNTYNALPRQGSSLPTAALEALQAGTHTYTTLAWLAAVPGDGLLTAPSTGAAHGTYLTPHTGALNHQLGYLRAAHGYLTELRPDVNLLAVTVD